MVDFKEIGDISDKPIREPSQDVFGYSDFVANLAMGITRLESSGGFVIGINGEWGSGKTTVLNLLEYHFNKDFGNDDKPIIIHFNPWWFSGYEDLTRRFFEQFLVEVSKHRKTDLKWEKLGKAIASFGDVVSSIPIQGAAPVGALMKYASGKKRTSLNKRKTYRRYSKI